MRVFINPGHDREYDSGAVNPRTGLREADVAWEIGGLVAHHLRNAGCAVEVCQSDNLCGDSGHADRMGEPSVVRKANDSGADVFVSIHCNALDGSGRAKGTETCVYSLAGQGAKLGQCIQSQVVESLGTTDRGLKCRPSLAVLRHTAMPAALVETAFIDNDDDARLLAERQDDFARAIARGVTDYQTETI